MSGRRPAAGRQHGMEEPCMTVQEQQKDQKAAQALEYSQGEARNSMWFVKTVEK